MYAQGLIQDLACCTMYYECMRSHRLNYMNFVGECFFTYPGLVKNGGHTLLQVRGWGYVEISSSH